ncbi:RDD family protein [Lysobacter solisilvae (ex Woo and Kim 2020)]|uniref:RDD family protein n=1 Tax=Agrilutibacter terrestris TaxID=2865112 RepID=A0A7H0FU06_9GAMM|nr:RDD family protein [Lysobacter terrestris]QNP39522.1 RDD family protein [Lysobacter terrestris]
MEVNVNPYAAPGAPVTVAMPPPLPTAARHAPLAGRGERLVAAIIDRALYVACFIPVLLAGMAQARSLIGVTVAVGFLAMACLFIYNLMLLGDNGQTVGKRWLAIRIVRTDGSDVDFGRLFALRMFVPWLLGFFLGPFFVLPDLLCIFGNEQRCLHDMLADTIVVAA